ncbi:hypothetical protein [Streptomyces sp. NPDC007094]
MTPVGLLRSSAARESDHQASPWTKGFDPAKLRSSVAATGDRHCAS